MPGIIGKKIGMTSLFTRMGKTFLRIEADPCVVTQVHKTIANDGYTAIQIGYGERKS
jgi:large subunit ribosomal protein L3